MFNLIWIVSSYFFPCPGILSEAEFLWFFLWRLGAVEGGIDESAFSFASSVVESTALPIELYDAEYLFWYHLSC